jgi:hypothetical protein
MHPFEKYNVTIGDDVVVAYATGAKALRAEVCAALRFNRAGERIGKGVKS